MAGQTVGNQTPHLSTEDEPGLKYLSFSNMSSVGSIRADIENGMNSYVEHLCCDLLQGSLLRR